jgi:hypothetical protein
MDRPERVDGSDGAQAPAPRSSGSSAGTPRALPGAKLHQTTRSAFSDVHADPARDGSLRDIRPRRRDPESPADPRTPDEADPTDPRAPRRANPGDIVAPTIGMQSSGGSSGRDGRGSSNDGGGSGNDTGGDGHGDGSRPAAGMSS